MGKLENWWIFPGFEIELVASGLNLPVNLAFVPNPSSEQTAPLLYLTELYGQIKVLTNNGQVHTYASGLLNYEPDHQFPGSGESGVTGICVEPKTGDLFISMIYIDNGETKAKVIRTASKDGLQMDTMQIIIDNIPSTTKAHQIQAVSIGFDEKLYVNVADGGEADMAQEMNDLRGKILRMNLDGTIPENNPARGSLVYAKGMRNPFGAAWRKSDQSLYVSINGPDRDDAIAKVEPGSDHGWPVTMRKNSMFCWEYTQAPTAIDFMQSGQFPEEFDDQLFVALFGNSYMKGRSVKGKKIVKMIIDTGSGGVWAYDEFVTYIGDGAATPCGLAFGPDGLYFSDLHGDKDDLAGSPSGHIYRVRPIKKLATATREGVVLAESDTYETVEFSVYFPPDSVQWDYLVKGTRTSESPRLGHAVYYDLVIHGKTIKNVAWSFPQPKEAARHIKDYVAFAYGEADMKTERSG